MARKVFQLVGEDGKALTSVDAVVVDIEDVFAFRKAVFAEVSRALPATMIASDLTVFENREKYDAKESLTPGAKIGALGPSEDKPLIMQVKERAVEGPSIENLRAGYDLLQTILPSYLIDVSTTVSDRDLSFKDNLCLFYNCYSRGMTWIRCMILDITFPASLVTGSHLFRRSRENVAFKMMQIKKIDDVQNGLLLFKPLGHAFDHFQISFIYDKHNDCFKLKLFDPSIRDTPIIDLMRDPNQRKVLMNAISKKRRPCSFDPKKTFGELDGKVLKFTSIGRPYNRCLNLQARLAQTIAMKKQVIDPSYQFDDFWSEGFSLADKMSMFRQSIADCDQV